jgi:hypothetical protein
MIRGTTAQFKFQIPYDFSYIKCANIVFWQTENNGPSIDRPLPIVKILSQCSQSNNPRELCVSLTQEETLRFSDKKKAYVQLKAESKDGYAFASKQVLLDVYPVYEGIDMDDIIKPTPTPSVDDYIVLDGQPIVLGGGS